MHKWVNKSVGEPGIEATWLPCRQQAHWQQAHPRWGQSPWLPAELSSLGTHRGWFSVWRDNPANNRISSGTSPKPDAWNLCLGKHLEPASARIPPSPTPGRSQHTQLHSPAKPPHGATGEGSERSSLQETLMSPEPWVPTAQPSTPATPPALTCAKKGDEALTAEKETPRGQTPAALNWQVTCGSTWGSRLQDQAKPTWGDDATGASQAPASGGSVQQGTSLADSGFCRPRHTLSLTGSLKTMNWLYKAQAPGCNSGGVRDQAYRVGVSQWPDSRGSRNVQGWG